MNKPTGAWQLCSICNLGGTPPPKWHGNCVKALPMWQGICKVGQTIGEHRSPRRSSHA